MTKESNQVIVARQINSLDAATATKAKSPRELANFQNKGKVSSANPQGRRTSGRTDAQKSSTKPHHPNDVKQFCDYNADNFAPQVFVEHPKAAGWGKVTERNPQGKRTSGHLRRPSAFKTTCNFNADLFPTRIFFQPGERIKPVLPQSRVVVSEYNAELFNPDFFEQQRLKNERWGKVSERNPQGRRTAGVMSRPSAFKTKCSFNADLFPTHTFCLPGELTGNPNPQHTIVKCIFNPKFFVAKIFNDRHGKFLKQSRVVQCDFDADLFVPEIFA